MSDSTLIRRSAALSRPNPPNNLPTGNSEEPKIICPSKTKTDPSLRVTSRELDEIAPYRSDPPSTMLSASHLGAAAGQQGRVREVPGNSSMPVATFSPKFPIRLLPAEDALSPTDMNGYLTFLKGLSEYQQRAQIAHLVFRERWGGFSMEEDILNVQPVSTFTESLGVGACS
jgi:hypothetical protein